MVSLLFFLLKRRIKAASEKRNIRMSFEIKYVEYGTLRFEVWKSYPICERVSSFKTFEEAKSFVTILEDIQSFNKRKGKDKI